MDKKTLFTRYGYFAAIFIVLVSLSFVMVFVARKPASTGMAMETQKVLDKAFPNRYVCGKMIPFQSSIQSSAYCFELKDRERAGDRSLYAVIMRRTTLYGPLSAVFVYDLNSESVSFAGLSSLNTNNFEQVYDTVVKSEIDFYTSRIPVMVKNTLELTK